MLTFRETPVTDATAAALLTEYFAFRVASFPSPGAYVTSHPEPNQFVEPRGIFLLGLIGTEPVACGGIRSLGRGIFEVKHLWVRPRVQRGGVGRAMLVELERRAVLLDATTAVLDTNTSLGAANRLYRSHGYSETEPYNHNPNATNWYSKGL